MKIAITIEQSKSMSEYREVESRLPERPGVFDWENMTPAEDDNLYEIADKCWARVVAAYDGDESAANWAYYP